MSGRIVRDVLGGAHPLRVIGLDLSLTSTGISDGQSRHAIQTGPDERLEARLDRLVRGVVSFALSPTQWTDRQPQGTSADLAVIEAPAWSRALGKGHEELSALRVMVRHRLWRLNIPYAMVAPNVLKLAVAGKGNASKAEMVTALDERYMAALDAVKVKDGRYDMADALGLAAMGYHHVGQPLPVHFPAPPLVQSSVDAVRWPDLLSD